MLRATCMCCHTEGVLPAAGGLIKEEEGYAAGLDTGCMVGSIRARTENLKAVRRGETEHDNETKTKRCE